MVVEKHQALVEDAAQVLPPEPLQENSATAAQTVEDAAILRNEQMATHKRALRESGGKALAWVGGTLASAALGYVAYKSGVFDHITILGATMYGGPNFNAYGTPLPPGPGTRIDYYTEHLDWIKPAVVTTLEGLSAVSAFPAVKSIRRFIRTAQNK